MVRSPVGYPRIRANTTVAEILAWYEAHEVRAFSADALKERRRLWGLFADQFGDLCVGEANGSHLLSFLVGQKGARSNWTRRRMKATIARPFNAAARLGLIDRNPFAGVTIPQGKDGRDWTDREYRAILRSSRPYFRRFVIFLRFSGARPGEARTLEWSHVREDVDVIVQARHKTAETSKEPRRIYFNHVITKLLLWLRRNRRHETFVFTNGRGGPWTIGALTKHLRDLRKRIGLPRDVRLHGGRHFFATSAIINGVDLFTLAQLLGHSSVATTERYIHLLDKKAHLNLAMERAIGQKMANT